MTPGRQSPGPTPQFQPEQLGVFICALYTIGVLHKILLRGFYCQISILTKRTSLYNTWNSQKYYKPSLSKHSKIPFFPPLIKEKNYSVLTQELLKPLRVSKSILISEVHDVPVTIANINDSNQKTNTN